MTATAPATVAAAAATAPRYRPLAFGVTRGVLREGASGVRYLEAETPLAPYGERITDRLGSSLQVRVSDER